VKSLANAFGSTFAFFFQSKTQTKKNAKELPSQRTRTDTMNEIYSDRKEQRRHNSTYKKLAVQWLNEALCFVSSSVVADSFRLRNRQLLLAANRYSPF